MPYLLDGQLAMRVSPRLSRLLTTVNSTWSCKLRFPLTCKVMAWKKWRRFNHATEKAGKQDWFKGVFEGAGMQEERPEEDCSKTFKRVSFK